MSGLNSAVLDLSLCGSLGTGIRSAMCEGKHQFTRKGLPPSFICGPFIHFVFYYLFSSSVGTWLTSATADSLLLFVFSHPSVSSQTNLTEGSSSSLPSPEPLV